jgi:hypothetical protein
MPGSVRARDATTVKTPLFFRQVIGRFVRTIAGMPADPSFPFVPARALARSGERRRARLAGREEGVELRLPDPDAPRAEAHVAQLGLSLSGSATSLTVRSSSGTG